MSEIATFPPKELFAKITESIQRSLRENLSKGTERELWEVLHRRSAGKFGVEIEIELKNIAQFLLKAFRTTHRALKSLVAKGFCEITRTLSGYGYRVILLVPKGCEIGQNCADTVPVLSNLGHSNPHSPVTYSLKEFKEKEQTGEFRFANSPLQKEGLRSPFPKPKPRNLDPESNPDPELTEALGLLAEYGVRCGNPKLVTNNRIRKAIATSARNLSSEKLAERVRNAIAATEQTRLKSGEGGLRKPIECLLSCAIARGHTPNIPKQQVAEAEPVNQIGSWLKEMHDAFPGSIYRLDRQGVDAIYRISDQAELGTFEELRDLPIEEIGQLINSPAAPNSQLPTPNPTEKVAVTPAAIAPTPPANPPTRQPPTANPTEDEVATAIALIPIFEQDLGISRSDRPAAIQKFIGVAVTGLSRLCDSQLLEYLKALQQADPLLSDSGQK